jgi:hypothetical protein
MMEKHIDVIGALWIVWGAIGIILGLFILGILLGISFIPSLEPEAPVILRTVGLGVGLFLVILSAPEVIAGIGLLKRQEWGRILALVEAFLNLFWIPLGTILGIYSIIILLNQETTQLFRAKPQKSKITKNEG